MGVLFGQTVDVRSATFAVLTDDQQIAAQAVRLILTTRLGSLWYAPESGQALRDYVCLGISTTRLGAIDAEVKAAIELDPRFAEADVTGVPTFTADGGAALRLNISVTPKAAADAPIQLVAFASAELVKVMVRGL